MSTIENPLYLTIRLPIDGIEVSCDVHCELNEGYPETSTTPGESRRIESVFFDEVTLIADGMQIESEGALERWLIKGLQNDYRTNPVFEARVDEACCKSAGF